MADIATWNKQEFDTWSDIVTLEHPSVLNDTSRDRLLTAISKAKRENKLISVAADQLYTSIKQLGVHFHIDDLKRVHRFQRFVAPKGCEKVLPRPTDDK